MPHAYVSNSKRFGIILITITLLLQFVMNLAHGQCFLEDTLDGQAAGEGFGLSVSNVGDVNNDGYPDFIVGAPWNDSAGTDAGAAYLYCGHTQALLYTFLGDSAGYWFGKNALGQTM